MESPRCARGIDPDRAGPAALLRAAGPAVALVAVLLAIVPSMAAAQSMSVVLPASGPAVDAWQALEAGRLREAEQLFSKALVASPDDTAALLGAAVVGRRLGQVGPARQWLTRALQIDPSLTSASLLLATMSRESGDLESALRAYEAALVRAPDTLELKTGAEACRAELAHLTRWPGDLGGETRLYFDGPVDEATARLALESAARARERIGSALGITAPDRVTVVLVTSTATRIIDKEIPEWSSSQFDGRIRMQVRPPVKDRAEFERMLTHECVHAVLRGVAPSGVPRWIEEGMAALLEPDGLARARRDLGTQTLLPFASLERSFASLPAAVVTTAYAQSAFAVARIIQRVGVPGVLGLMRDLTAGDRFADAFRSRVGVSYEEFQREFAASRRGR